MENKMFCFQCQETAGCTGCTKFGVCGKSPDLARMQDLLIYTTKGLSEITTRLRAEGQAIDGAVNHLITINLFTTITNANFDDEVFYSRVRETLNVKNELMAKLKDTANLSEAALWDASSNEEMDKKSDIGVLATKDEDVRSLRELITYGLKGMSAYMKHANALGYDDEAINAFMQATLAKTLDDNLSIDELIALTLETGKVGVDGMALLDSANTGTYGHPEITKVNIGVRNNPGILVSGHDLKDLELLLKQTEGTGVDVYTHSEMLPAHYYPAFKKYSHFAGNYGNAWWKQKEEFESFNGPILMTTNCIVPPKDSYKDRIYTTGAAGFAGVKHIKGVSEDNKDFSEIIEQAKKCAPPTEIETGEIVGGFAHNQVFALADQVVDAVKTGAIKKFFVMGGCDGRAKSRNYYTEFVKSTPMDSLVLTLACGKYRFNDLDLGEIDGLPRIIDMGQCNDAYSAIKVAMALSEVFECSISDLPLTLVLSWYEQKAVCILLTLLSLGIKNMYLGPTMPAFLSEGVLKIIIDKFNLQPITNPLQDMDAILGRG